VFSLVLTHLFILLTQFWSI